MSRYLVAAVIVVGGSSLVVALAGVEIWLDNRRYRQHRYTVIWRENRFEHCALTGTVERVDADWFMLDDGHGTTVLVERHDIEGVY